jgi:hypothetical protein
MLNLEKMKFEMKLMNQEMSPNQTYNQIKQHADQLEKVRDLIDMVCG